MQAVITSRCQQASLISRFRFAVRRLHPQLQDGHMDTPEKELGRCLVLLPLDVDFLFFPRLLCLQCLELPTSDLGSTPGAPGITSCGRVALPWFACAALSRGVGNSTVGRKGERRWDE